MTDPAIRVTELRDAIQDKGSITSRVTGIGALSRFDEAFKSYDFIHEKPYIMMELENRIEDIQVLISIGDLTEEPLRTLFKDSNINDILGSSLNIKVNDSFKEICLENPNNDNKSKTSKYRPRVQKTSKVRFAGRHAGLLRTRTNGIDRADRMITNTLTRCSNSTDWMKVDLKYRETDDETVVYAVENDRELTAEWSFHNGIQGTRMLQDFADNLQAIQLLDDDIGKCSAWVKPIWDLESYETKDEIFVSDDEYWVVSEDPHEDNKRSLKDILTGLTGLWSEKKLTILSGSDLRRSASCSYCGDEDWYVKL